MAVDPMELAWRLENQAAATDASSRNSSLSCALLAEAAACIRKLVEQNRRACAEVEWQPIETAPKDGTPFYARHQSPYRYQPYKPGAPQLRVGKKGRWQSMNDYGGWENCEEPFGDWKHHPDYPTLGGSDA